MVKLLVKNVTVYSGGVKHENGVGIMMKREVEKLMIVYWPISDRVMIMKLHGQPFNINVIQVHAPNSDHPDSEIEEFYDQVNIAIQYVKSGEMFVICKNPLQTTSHQISR